MIYLKNKNLKVTINTKGAEVVSVIQLADNQERIYQKTGEWKRSAPILFPLIGKVGLYEVDNIEYEMPNHGFARDLDFTVIEKNEKKVVMYITSSRYTKYIFPYEFKLIVQYEIIKNKLIKRVKIENNDIKEMYFALGEHPSFNISHLNNTYIDFHKNHKKLIVENDEITSSKMETNILSLNSNKAKETHIANNVNVASLYDCGKKIIEVKSYGYDNIAIWSNNQSFVCIEPWKGMIEIKSGSKNLEEKQNVNKLDSGNHTLHKTEIEFISIMQQKIKKNRKINYLIFSILSVIVLLFSVLGSSLYYNHLNEQPYGKFQKYYDALVEEYPFMIDEDFMEQNILSGMVRGLGNRFSTYLTKDGFESFNNKKPLAGINFSINPYQELIVSQIVTNSTADGKNIYPGDIITNINGNEINHLTIGNYQQYIEGEKLDLKYTRPSTAEKLTISLEKSLIPLETISAKLFEENGKKIGYIKITEFEIDTDEQFKIELDKFKEQKIDELVIDVCNNPGGYLETVGNIISQLVVTDGDIYQLRGKENIESAQSDLKEEPNFGIVVLQNKNSASASEMLSLVLQEAGHTVIGTTSYGKGTAQAPLEIPGYPGYAYITIAEWFSGKGTSIEGVGVKPDLEIEGAGKKISPIYLTDTLKEGDVGQNVLLMNKYLKYSGYNVNMESSTFDENSTKALKAFQTKNKLKSTGVLDTISAYELYKFAEINYDKPEFNNLIRKALDYVSTRE